MAIFKGPMLYKNGLMSSDDNESQIYQVINHLFLQVSQVKKSA